jgi:hypothetical protein
MRLERYHCETDNNLMLFEFVSEGPKGQIIKQIQYSKMTDAKDVYNLAFGDRKNDDNEIDDIVVTDNKDSEKVLATVAVSVLTFTDKYKGVRIFAIGSTKARTRLYQIGIAKHLEELSIYFDIYGYIDDDWMKFQKNMPYEAFFVKRK